MASAFRLLSLVCLVGIATLVAATPAEANGSDDQDPTLVTTLVSYGFLTDGTSIVWADWDYAAPVEGSASAIYAADLADHTTREVASGLGLRVPMLKDGIVLWSEHVAGSTCCSAILGQVLATGQPVEIATGSTWATDPDISGNMVVWTAALASGAPGDIHGRDLTTGEEFIVAATADAEFSPVISGTRAAWISQTGASFTIMTRDLATAAPPTVVAIRPGTLGRDSIELERLDGDRLYWNEGHFDQGGHYNGLFLTQQLGDAEPISWFLGRHSWSGADHDAQGDLIAVSKDGSLVEAVNLQTGETTVLGGGGMVATDGLYVFWQEFVSYPDRMDLMGYDTATGSRFLIRASTNSWEVEARSGMLVWGANDGVHAAPARDVLPTARRPASPPDAHRTYFAETGHHLAWGFRDFWNGNGGLPVFGYPLTEEYTERSADTGQDDTVQFTERQRFEWHPENAGTRYEVLLGRLGAELLVRQGRDWTTFPKADPSAQHYMAVTGHAIAPQFWAYWSSHGLDLGDPGVSFQESLALFGYPLSEPMMETNGDGDTVLTQYFERAVFEYHSANATPYDVLLRRLGAEELAARGW